MHGNDDSAASAVARAAACLDRLLDETARAVGAHIGALYLQVPEQHMLQMTAVTGVPSRLARPWSRVALAAPVPVAEAARSQAPVWLPDQQELARRFPRTALSFPYAIAMYVVPLRADGADRGAMLLLWPGSRAEGLPAAGVARIDEAAERLARVLGEAADQGHPVHPREEPLAVHPPPARRGARRSPVGGSPPGVPRRGSPAGEVRPVAGQGAGGWGRRQRHARRPRIPGSSPQVRVQASMRQRRGRP